MTLPNRPLGGWTRLWVAVTVLWLMVVGGGAWLFSDGPWQPYYVVAELGGHLDSAVRDKVSDNELPNRIVTTPSGRVISIPGDSTLDEERQVIALEEARSSSPGAPRAVTRYELPIEPNAELPRGSVSFWGRPVFYDPIHFTTEESIGELRAQLDRAYATERSIRWWSRVRGIVALALLPPVVLFVFGWTVGWVLRGFRPTGASGG